MKKFNASLSKVKWILVVIHLALRFSFGHNTNPKNHSQDCHLKVSAGACASNPDYMFAHCSTNCVESELGTTVKILVETYDEEEEQEEEEEEEEEGEEKEKENKIQDSDANVNQKYFYEYIRVHFGIEQQIHPEHSLDPNMIMSTLDHIVKTNQYMKSFLSDEFSNEHHVITTEQYDENQVYYSECYNSDTYCTSLAVAGKCIPPEHYDEDHLDFKDLPTHIYEFMMRYCAPACRTCKQLIETLQYEQYHIDDCNPDRSTDIFQPGDLNRMFERIVEEAKDHKMPYTVNILSRPRRTSTILDHPPDDILYPMNQDDHDDSDGPWIITIDNFLSEEECDRLIELGGIEVYEASGLIEENDMSEEEWQNALKQPGRARTSTNAWCQNECYEDELAKQVVAKIERLTGVPDNYQEWLQLVKYLPGQYYKMHHDNSEEMIDEPSGPRLLTVFMYLNNVEEGGATRFNDLLGDGSMVHLDVFPRKGTALIWPSVLDHAPNRKMDYRTFHEAMIVKKGIKYGANAWLRIRDYKTEDDYDECDYDEYKWIMKKRKLLSS